MARLLVKKTPWWVAHRGQVLFWLPMATLQAGTLTGLAYAWDRLSDLEQQASKMHGSDTVATGVVNRETAPQGLLAIDQVRAVPPLFNHPASLSPTPITSVTAWKEPLPVPPASTAIIKPVSMNTIPSRPLQSVKRSAKSDKTVAKAQAKGVLTVSTTKHPTPPAKVVTRAERAAAKAATTALTPKQQLALWEAAKTAQANREYGNERVWIAPVTDEQVDIAPKTPTIMPPRNAKASTVPVGSSVWVYLGQLRDYGWYGQKLHISPRSGLPEVGRSYLTQQIHGYYDAPHGKRYMGGLQQGDKVIILQVVREENGDVWGKILKEASVGRLD